VAARVEYRLSPLNVFSLIAVGGAACRPYARIGGAISVALILAGCVAPAASPTPYHRAYSYQRTDGAPHIVQRGETVYHIAQLYGVSVDALMAANGIGDPRQLRVGQALTIPAGEDSAPATASKFALPNPWSVPRADRQFAWPVATGVVASPFGVRNGVMHNGVDIAAPAGTPVLAADNGTVIYVGRERGYGNLVILQHSGGYVTVYGHNRRNLVDIGASVARGQEIAEMGTTGRASGSNLHFEVRYQNHAQNPLAYLPPPDQSTAISFARAGGS
jgi:lipoprotein NlpD